MELKDILEAIDYKGDAESLDREKLVGHINSKFVARDRAFEDPDVLKQTRGRVFGELNGRLAKITGKSKSELQEMGAEGAFDLLDETYEGLNTKLTDATTKAKEGHSKQLLDLQADNDDLNTSLTQYKQATTEAQAAAAAAVKERDQGIRGFKVKHHRNNLFAAMPWAEDVNPYIKTGIQAEIESNYRFDLDENDMLVIKDKDGLFVPNPKQAGGFLGASDVLTQLAEKAGALKNNNGPGTPPPGPQQPAPPAQGDVPEHIRRRMAAQAPRKTTY